MVAWRESYLDLILIPLGLLLPALYHAWLWRAVRRRPLSTAFGVYSAARRLWAAGMMRDNDDKKGVLVVQSIRNVIMGSTLMATTSVLFCTGIAAVLSSTYSVKKPLSDARSTTTGFANKDVQIAMEQPSRTNGKEKQECAPRSRFIVGSQQQLTTVTPLTNTIVSVQSDCKTAARGGI
ncbi:hypothetical protein TRIUR3_34319 [Triticum urartu]|uniref:Uncharacterized protein n=1 Tax=Triticum urartu TaxID=4572 RepID=M8ASG7_TRIUA|nr:hypothetical protein TRIUR3_34319 [Triticum urartu]